MTFNQVRYIAECLQSIVDQQTDFQFEVLVADDCSTDGTRQIVNSFAERYGGVIRPLLHERNIGPYQNFAFVHEQARGQYVAHIDGDDYMLPGKLQAQADFLDKNENCNIVWHRMLIHDERTGSLREDSIDLRKLPANGCSRGDILRFMAIGLHSAKMYRRSAGRIERPDFEMIDYFANVEQVRDKRGCFVSDVPLGVYRVGVGIASSGNTTKRIMCKTLLHFATKYPDHRLDINTAALTCLVVELKNRRRTAFDYLKVWIRTFHPASILTLLRGWPIIRMLRLNG